MEDRFKPLECNDDVLSFEDNNKLFKVCKFKLKIENEIRKKFDFLDEKHKIEEKEYYIIDYLREVFIDGLNFNDAYMNLECIFPKEGVKCELMILGCKSWQNGKLRIRAYIESFYNEKKNQENLNVQITLEFSPDEPQITEPESPLDEIRRKINEVST